MKTLNEVIVGGLKNGDLFVIFYDGVQRKPTKDVHENSNENIANYDSVSHDDGMSSDDEV